jgi:hypothetical protein
MDVNVILRWARPSPLKLLYMRLCLARTPVHPRAPQKEIMQGRIVNVLP